MFRVALNRFVSKIPVRQDMLLVAILVLTIGMMILPVPTLFADILIVLSMSIAVLLMLVAVYIRAPVEFSTLPSIILITTAFRLSLSITTARMVLVQADAGAIIQTFGNFVVAGNVVVGLVIYLIISIVQFVVITKGSERVAEVAARFSLDALPGQQVAIDADLRNGDINQAEARCRRTLLQKESQLYGSMDGAMKFVKGDAIASLVIIVINLIGGILIGCMQRGLDFTDAANTYSLLAVGDGLIAQIPALLMSLTAGIVVTRIASDDGGNLGRDIVGQMSADTRTLYIAAAILAVMGFVPGFPMPVFFAFGGCLAGAAKILSFNRGRDKLVAFKEAAANESARPVSVAVSVHLGVELMAIGPSLEQKLVQLRGQISNRIGITVPAFRLSPEPIVDAASGRIFRVDVDGVPAFTGELDLLNLFAEHKPELLTERKIPFIIGAGPFGPSSLIVSVDAVPALQDAGVHTADAGDYVTRVAERSMLAHAERLIGIQETKAIVQAAEAHFPELVRESIRSCPLPRLSDVLRLLVDEQVPLNHTRQILESTAEWAPREQTTGGLMEHVRGALRRQICHMWSNGAKVLNAMAVEALLEESLRRTLHTTPKGMQMNLDQASAQQLSQVARDLLAAHLATNVPAIVLTAPDLRRPMRLFLRSQGMDVPVLSFTEIAPEFSVQVFGTLSPANVPIFKNPEAARANIRLVS